MQKRILIFSLAYYPVVGGAEVAVKEITDRLPDIEFDMVTLRFEESHPEKEKIDNCTIYRINSSKNLFPFRAFSFAKKLHHQKPYDIAWAIMANWAGFATLFFKWKFPRVKYVLTLQEGDPIEYIKKKVRFVYPLFKKVFLKADLVQTISHYLADWARDMGYKGQIEVIPNGVDIKKFENLNPKYENKNEVVLITTSRLVEKNGIGDVIDALTLLPQNVKFKILGIGPLESELKLKAKSNNLETRVEFLGFVDQKDIPKHLHLADIFIRPSLSEGMGNSFIEAMAAGLPVIATPVGGIPDFLKDGETGIFCQVRDPESIAAAVKRLMNEPDLRRKITENAKRMVEEKYDWDLIAQEIKDRVFK